MKVIYQIENPFANHNNYTNKVFFEDFNDISEWAKQTFANQAYEVESFTYKNTGVNEMSLVVLAINTAMKAEQKFNITIKKREVWTN